MRKSLFFPRVAILSLVALTLGLSACSDDNGNEPNFGPVPELPALEYESSAAKYTINSAESSIASIELTADGEYIVIDRYANPGEQPEPFAAQHRTALRPPMLHLTAPTISRAGNQGVITGKFIKLSDTEYILEGWGSIVIEGDPTGGPNAFSLIVTDADGDTKTFPASMDNKIASSEKAIAMCRAWDVAQMGCKVVINGALVFNGDKPASQMDNLFKEADNALYAWYVRNGGDPEDWDPYEPFGFYPTQIIMTRSGTYMVVYSNGELAISTWRWINEEEGRFSFSWDYDDPDADGIDNFVSFTGNDMNISENHTETDIEDGERITIASETRYRLTLPK